MKLLTVAALGAGLMLVALDAHAGRLRTQAQWGGLDLPFSCATVRAHRAEIEGMSPAMRSFWIKTLHVTRKQQRQARACLR
jgi:hypothetical protein